LVASNLLPEYRQMLLSVVISPPGAAAREFNMIRHMSSLHGNEIHRSADHMGGAVPIPPLQLISNIALFRQ
jgi:hypothetical protein